MSIHLIDLRSDVSCFVTFTPVYLYTLSFVVLNSFRWCLVSSDVGWHIRDKLRPLREHGSIYYIALRPRKPETSLGRTAQDGQLDSHTAPELLCCVELSTCPFIVWNWSDPKDKLSFYALIVINKVLSYCITLYWGATAVFVLHWVVAPIKGYRYCHYH